MIIADVLLLNTLFDDIFNKLLPFPHLFLSIKTSLFKPCRHGLVLSVSASHEIGHGFASWTDFTKDHHKNCTNSPPPSWHVSIRVGV